MHAHDRGDRDHARRRPLPASAPPSGGAPPRSGRTAARGTARCDLAASKPGTADTLTRVRVLVVTNFEPDAAAPQRGRWVRDQVDEVRKRGIEVDVFSFPPGRGEYIPATRRLRALLRRERFDLVHAHYGLPGWCARLAGARPLIVTFHGTDVRHRVVGPLSRRLAWRVDLVAAVSRALFAPEDGRPGLPAVPGSAVLPCGPDLDRFGPQPAGRGAARARARPRRPLPLLPRQPGPAREAPRPRRRAGRRLRRRAADRRLDRAGADAALDQRRQRRPRHLRLRGLRDGRGRGARLRRAGPLDPGRRSPPTPSAGIDGCLCAPFDAGRLGAPPRGPTWTPPTPASRAPRRAASLSAARMAERVIEAYRDVTGIPVLD